MFKKLFIFLYLTSVLQTSFCDDLIDEYVEHVSKRNKLERGRRAVQPEMKWTHAETLDAAGDVILRWQPRHQEIAFKIEARTLGYVGVGFSPSGGMKGADIVIGWVDDVTGQAFLLVSAFYIYYSNGFGFQRMCAPL